jgi:hypothetical protein
MFWLYWAAALANMKPIAFSEGSCFSVVGDSAGPGLERVVSVPEGGGLLPSLSPVIQENRTVLSVDSRYPRPTAPDTTNVRAKSNRSGIFGSLLEAFYGANAIIFVVVLT